MLLSLKIDYLFCLFFSFLDLIMSLSHLFFLSILFLITFWKPFGISSVMICWLSNGEGPLGGGGSALQTVCCWGGGGRLRNKTLAGGGATKKWRVYQKIAQPPTPTPHPQLINNDQPLFERDFIEVCTVLCPQVKLIERNITIISAPYNFHTIKLD